MCLSLFANGFQLADSFCPGEVVISRTMTDEVKNFPEGASSRLNLGQPHVMFFPVRRQGRMF